MIANKVIDMETKETHIPTITVSEEENRKMEQWAQGYTRKKNFIKIRKC